MAEIKNALPRGTVVHGKYTVEKVLGAGGFGITYLVYTFFGNARVPLAMKEYFLSSYCERSQSQVVYSQASSNEFDAGKTTFLAEAERLKKQDVRHPNIVGVNEVFEENGTAYYVMEYIKGKDIRQYVLGDRNGKPVDENTAKKLLKPIMQAVALLHRNRITHLDIKPDNIVLSTMGGVHPILIDFGLSKHYDEKGGVTSTFQYVAASAGYAPVEQIAGGGLTEFTPQADVYALAATLFFMVTGKDPDNAANLASDPEKLPEALEGKVSQRTIDAIVNAMKISKKKRTQSVEDFARELGLNIAPKNKPSANATQIVSTPAEAPTEIVQTASHDQLGTEIVSSIAPIAEPGHTEIVQSPLPKQSEVEIEPTMPEPEIDIEPEPDEPAIDANATVITGPISAKTNKSGKVSGSSTSKRVNTSGKVSDSKKVKTSDTATPNKSAHTNKTGKTTNSGRVNIPEPNISNETKIEPVISNPKKVEVAPVEPIEVIEPAPASQSGGNGMKKWLMIAAASVVGIFVALYLLGVIFGEEKVIDDNNNLAKTEQSYKQPSASSSVSKPSQQNTQQTTPQAQKPETTQSQTEAQTPVQDTQSGTSQQSQQPQIAIPTASNETQGHQWVDLGLSVKWATTNIGASSQTARGNFYSWGDTQAKKSNLDSNTLAYGKNNSALKSQGILGSNGNLAPSHDIATLTWGSKWRMPTNGEMRELVTKCKWVWKGNGYEVTGPHGNSIFMPAGGLRVGDKVRRDGQYGFYWTATPNNDTKKAYNLILKTGSSKNIETNDRDVGATVRAVTL